MTVLTQELAAHCADIVLGHIRQEYPNRLDQTLGAPEVLLRRHCRNPTSFGSGAWKSSVHGP